MNIIRLFISRPVGVTLLTFAVAIIGFVAYALLPVSSLPQVDFPTILVRAAQPGASPETMATTVATPLERALGRVAGITEMTSHSSLGSTIIILQFDLNRDINGAARDVQAAINAAQADLPVLPHSPTYRKLNPSDLPIMLLSLSSDSLPVDELFDIASTVLAQKISQTYGVGEVRIGGGALPAVRVNVNPELLHSQNMSMADVRSMLAMANINLPKGFLDNGEVSWSIAANDKLTVAEDFSPLVLRHKEGTTIRLRDVGIVSDGIENIHNAGFANGKRSILLIVFRQPGVNIIETIKKVQETIPLLREWIPESVDLQMLVDRSPSIRNSVKEMEKTLIISMFLVVLVVWLFLHNGRATFIPAVAVPVSLLGTFAVMYISGFSLNHLSLIALTVATGFVVDDAIVVTENIVRHMEDGEPPYVAAERGGREVYFTVISISLSLVAIFIPILGMGGLPGRLFKEFAVTLSAAVLVSLVVSLVTTPTMCAHLLHSQKAPQEGIKEKVGFFANIFRLGNKIFFVWMNFLDFLHEGYSKALAWVLRKKLFTLLMLFATIALNIYLYIVIPKGFFPNQDSGQMRGSIVADQTISFKAMQPKFLEFMRTIESHPDVQSVGGFLGGGAPNSGRVFLSLKPIGIRKKTTDMIIADLRGMLSHIPGTESYMMNLQDVRMGGRESHAEYQFTLRTDDLRLLREWVPKLEVALKNISGIADLSSDQDTRGVEHMITMNRDKMAAYGVTFQQVDLALGLAFGQNFASTIYAGTNQYRVVLEYDKEYLAGVDALHYVYVPATQGHSDISRETSAKETDRGNRGVSEVKEAQLIPLHALVDSIEPALTALAVTHQGQFIASTFSFNLEKGYALSEIQEQIDNKLVELGVPLEIVADFQGTAQLYTQVAGKQPLLILATILSLYIVLGVLYESLIHPITILSTLPSAGIGALLGLQLFNTEFTVIAFIGVLLLAGIVKKNAIMMIDFAIMARREEGLSAEAAIYKACLLRFRPIMMTTMAAICGAVPLLFSGGEGAELSTPLGITIVGGLVMSQILTLFSTPVVYLYLDRFSTPPEKRLIRQLEQEAKRAN